MQVFSVDTGKFKLDGGAMFGVVPKGIFRVAIFDPSGYVPKRGSLFRNLLKFLLFMSS